MYVCGKPGVQRRKRRGKAQQSKPAGASSKTVFACRAWQAARCTPKEAGWACCQAYVPQTGSQLTDSPTRRGRRRPAGASSKTVLGTVSCAARNQRACALGRLSVAGLLPQHRRLPSESLCQLIGQQRGGRRPILGSSSAGQRWAGRAVGWRCQPFSPSSALFLDYFAVPCFRFSCCQQGFESLLRERQCNGGLDHSQKVAATPHVLPPVLRAAHPALL
jgi:hypothetical protein